MFDDQFSKIKGNSKKNNKEIRVDEQDDFYFKPLHVRSEQPTKKKTQSPEWPS